MLFVLIVLVWLYCGLSILITKGLTRMSFFYIGILLVPATLRVIQISLLIGHTFFATMFVFSLVIHREFNIRTFSFLPVKGSVLFIFIASLLIGLFDSRVGPITGVQRGITHFISTYFLIYVGWLSVDSVKSNIVLEDSYLTFFKRLLPVVFIMTIYGLITAFTKSNPVLDTVGLEDRFFSEDMAAAGNYRAFRVTSFCVSSSVYGFACAILFLCSFALPRHRTLLQTVVIVMLAINVFLSATRAAIIPFLIGFCLFVILNNKSAKIISYILIGLLALIIVIPILPSSISGYFGQVFNSIIDVISPSGSGGSEYGGSSLSARGMQILGAMQYLKEKPLFGHGYAYFAEVISQGEKDDVLLGMESYLCFIGVEYGIVYFIAVAIFIISCMGYFIRNRNIEKLYCDLGISLIVMFIFFLIFAWVGGCWYFIMPILGYIMKIIRLSRYRMTVK